MSGFLLDTNVLSESRKTSCNANVKNWLEKQPPAVLYVSSITLAEIRYGASLVEDQNFRHTLLLWLDTVLRPWFEGRTLEVNEDIIVRWREMVQIGREKNYTFGQPDLFIAALADVHGLCVVTRNVKDFEKAGVAVLNPWNDESLTLTS
jgi:predicted nucleic acid-binding protein